MYSLPFRHKEDQPRIVTPKCWIEARRRSTYANSNSSNLLLLAIQHHLSIQLLDEMQGRKYFSAASAKRKAKLIHSSHLVELTGDHTQLHSNWITICKNSQWSCDKFDIAKCQWPEAQSELFLSFQFHCPLTNVVVWRGKSYYAFFVVPLMPLDSGTVAKPSTIRPPICLCLLLPQFFSFKDEGTRVADK